MHVLLVHTKREEYSVILLVVVVVVAILPRSTTASACVAIESIAPIEFPWESLPIEDDRLVCHGTLVGLLPTTGIVVAVPIAVHPSFDETTTRRLTVTTKTTSETRWS